VVADTRDQVGRINGLAHRVRVATGQVTEEASDAVVTGAGERIGVGDRIATRRNDTHTDVANRETWTVTATRDGALVVDGNAGRRVLPTEYVREHVELAYATTAYGAQGITVPAAHVAVGDHTGASSAYVGMTRGHHHNTAHLVAESLEEARRQWIDVFGRDRADLGPTHAARLAADAVDRYGPTVATGPTGSGPRARRLSPAELERRDAARRRRNLELVPERPASSRSPDRSRGLGL
jgi:hypothetical protein